MLLFGACKKAPIESGPVLPPPPLPPVAAPVVTMNLKAVHESVGNASEGYYVGLPSDYDSSNKRYPILVYLPGAGQFGNGRGDLPLLLKDGPAQLIEEQKFPGSFFGEWKTAFTNCFYSAVSLVSQSLQYRRLY